jgi:hypothetical protein
MMRRLYVLRWPATIALLALVVLHDGIGDA